MTTLPLDIAAFTGLPGIPEEAVTHGEVFTRPWVVEAILDLVDWRDERDLSRLRLVEPACGAGAFVGPIARRVARSCRRHGRPLTDAAGCVRAFDLLASNVAASRAAVRLAVSDQGWDEREVDALAAAWIRQGDYLLSDAGRGDVDVVVGNPPYIRLEHLPDARMKAYRTLWPAMVGRADVYVGFIEAALRSLRPGGTLGFVCADRWMRNQYGRALRRLITDRFAVETIIGMHEVDAFETPVSAYPAIVVVRRRSQKAAVIADTTASFDAHSAQELVAWVEAGANGGGAGKGWRATSVTTWPTGSQPWPATTPAVAAALSELSRRLPALGEPASAVRVGIGVATGADSVFITRDPGAVEGDRLLPLAMARDTATGAFAWSGHHLVNPWTPDGKLIPLSEFPRLRHYLHDHRELLAGRHVGRRDPTRWYRTIDRVDHSLVDRPKLLFPDMKAASHPVLEPGGHYPHHNLYWVTSGVWDLEVLGGLLLSKIAEAFVGAFGVRMRGGTLRFQAQYLRLIRVPAPATVKPDVADGLRDAFRRRDVDAATEVALAAYQLDRWPGWERERC